MPVITPCTRIHSVPPTSRVTLSLKIWASIVPDVLSKPVRGVPRVVDSWETEPCLAAGAPSKYGLLL